MVLYHWPHFFRPKLALELSYRLRLTGRDPGFIRTDNYRARVLKKLAEQLGLAKLNFQVLRRTMATLAHKEGGVKDVPAVLGHSRPDITAAVYLQTIEDSVKQTLHAIYAELTARPNLVAVS